MTITKMKKKKKMDLKGANFFDEVNYLAELLNRKFSAYAENAKYEVFNEVKILPKSIESENETEIFDEDICIAFREWKEFYREENNLVEDNFIELYVGSLSGDPRNETKPLKFSECFYLNTYRMGLFFGDGRVIDIETPKCLKIQDDDKVVDEKRKNRYKIIKLSRLTKSGIDLFSELIEELIPRRWNDDTIYDLEELRFFVLKLIDYLEYDLDDLEFNENQKKKDDNLPRDEESYLEQEKQKNDHEGKGDDYTDKDDKSNINNARDDTGEDRREEHGDDQGENKPEPDNSPTNSANCEESLIQLIEDYRLSMRDERIDNKGNKRYNKETKNVRYIKCGGINYCMYYDIWKVPYREDGEIIDEEFIEIFIGKLTKNNPLTFSEAICINTYQCCLRFFPNNVTIPKTSSSVQEPNENTIALKDFSFEGLKKRLGVDDWERDVTYNQNMIKEFRQYLADYLRKWTKPNISDKKRGSMVNKEEDNELVIDPQEVLKDFESGDFYEPLINILQQQDTIMDVFKAEKRSNPGLKGPMDLIEAGKDLIYYNLTKEPFKQGNKMYYETILEIFIGRVKKNKPLIFQESFSLNTYHGSLSFSKGLMTYSRHNKINPRNLIKVHHELLEKLKILLKPYNWDKEQTYNKKYITPFIRTLENYFLGQNLGKNYRILKKEVLYSTKSGNNFGDIISLIVDASDVAREAKAGQFVVIRLHERGERFPLTIADSSKENGTIRLIFQVVGKSTEELASLEENDFILDLLGPLGKPIEVKKYDKPVLCIAGGVGIACIYPKLKALKKAGNYIVSIIGARSEEYIILKDDLIKYSDEIYFTTDDGEFRHRNNGLENFYRVRKNGEKIYGGFVNAVLEALLGRTDLLEKENEKITEDTNKFIGYGPISLFNKYKEHDFEEVIAVGPIPMMWSVVATIAKENHYKPMAHYRQELPKVLVSLNPIMIDGTGMCGGCRVNIFNPETRKYETKFTCVDGPTFNGMLVDFESLFKRTSQYKLEEKKAIKYLELIGW
ncbi:MAG: sulfide/dihydroorotate dehydrogenase-like FAD/NAD-binding protein [Promethearchaeota archaeon]